MKLPYRVLVLDDDEHALSGIVELLRDAGHHVTGAATYDAANRLLALSPFDLLVSDVHLRSFNGLHLVMQTRADHPETAIIIITGYDDPLIDLEAHRYRADLVRKPIRPAQFNNTVTAALEKVRRQRRWPRKRVDGAFSVMVDGTRASVVDVSYDGLRITLPHRVPLPSVLELQVASIGLRLPVEPVWSRPAADNQATLCGASLTEHHGKPAETWRAIVDRLNA
jgi:DNA-binding response OmpR family regulator